MERTVLQATRVGAVQLFPVTVYLVTCLINFPLVHIVDG